MREPKYFRSEINGNTVIFESIGNIAGLIEDEAREEWDTLLEHIDEHNAEHVVIDLAQLDYFGSIMLELMVVLWKKVHAEGGKLAICNASDIGMEILKTAKFDSIWPILTTRDEAIEFLSKG